MAEQETAMRPEVAGYCPMGCGMTLVLAGMEYAGEGNITCTNPECLDPSRAHKLLQDPETEHIVAYEGSSFSVQHPLRERVGGELFNCDVHRRLQEAEPRERGSYRVTIHEPDAYSESYRPGDAGLDFEPV